MMRPSELAFHEILENALHAPITRITRRHSEYESSFALENLDVVLEDGNTLEMVFKDVGPYAILPAAKDSKQEIFFDPMREIQMYRSILFPNKHCTPLLHALHIDKSENHYWIFLERVGGLKLSFTGDFTAWLASVRWLASFHAEFSGRTDDVKNSVPTIEYDAVYYRRWCDRAVDFVARTAPASSMAMRQLADRYDQVIDRLMCMPLTLCHGDCYPSNILVRTSGHANPICVVDWELAAIGPGLIDLASLTAGKWNTHERERFISAYWNATPPAMPSLWPTEKDLNEQLNWCRLHLAVQWLGWSPKWAPPVDQANDWLEEMITLGRTLGLL